MGYLGGFILSMGFVILCFAAEIKSAQVACAIIVPICVFALLFPGAYYLYRFFRCKKKADSLPRLRGTVCNWELGEFTRYYASVIVVSDGKEYQTSNYLSAGYAKELVGREIEYCIIDDVLFIYEVIE